MQPTALTLPRYAIQQPSAAIAPTLTQAQVSSSVAKAALASSDNNAAAQAMMNAVEITLHTCLIAKFYGKEYQQFRVTGYHLDAHGANFHVSGDGWASATKDRMLCEIIKRNLLWLFGASLAGVREDTRHLLITRDMQYAPTSSHVQALIKQMQRYIAGPRIIGRIEKEMWGIGIDVTGHSHHDDWHSHLTHIRTDK